MSDKYRVHIASQPFEKLISWKKKNQDDISLKKKSEANELHLGK